MMTGSQALGRQLWRKGPEGTAERCPELLCAGENAGGSLGLQVFTESLLWESVPRECPHL